VTRRFQLVRDVDETGISGTGIVAEGVAFQDGTIAMRWTANNLPSSTAIYGSITAVEKIHGHGGVTRIVWVD
jgi:hypothetical protein